MLKQMGSWLIDLNKCVRWLIVQNLNARSWKVFCDFRRMFKTALDDMDLQYLEIRQARKALFDYDGAGDSHFIDLELERCDEMIDWSVCEPDTDVLGEPETTNET